MKTPGGNWLRESGDPGQRRFLPRKSYHKLGHTHAGFTPVGSSQMPQSSLQHAFFAFAEGGTSFAGFCEKNPLGLSKNPMYAVGITG